MDNAKAIAIIDKARSSGALAFVGQGFGDVVPLYKPDVTLLAVTPKDFHNIQGKLCARKETVDKIGDAAGIDYIAAQCGVRTEIREDDELGKRTIYIGYAQGRVRLPDGTWRASTVEEYEFDPVLRARLDKKDKLEYMKAARQRASTGARLRVVRQLTGMPTAFEAKDLGEGKDLVFGRIVQNTDYILSTPEGRAMAIAQAVGVTGQLFGGRNAPAQIPAAPIEERDATPADTGPAPDPSAGSDWDDGASDAELRVAALQGQLADYIASGLLPAQGVQACQAAIDRGETDPIILGDLAKRAKAAHDKALAKAQGAA